MNKHFFFFITFMLASMLCGCHSIIIHDDEYDRLVVGNDTIDSLCLAQTIDSLIHEDNDTLPADCAMRRFYRGNHWVHWITNDGVTPQADTLMAFISHAHEFGFDSSQFFYKEIDADRKRIDSLDFSCEDVYTVIARHDMLLTKAFLRYAAGQRYGFTDPKKLFNELDRNMIDTSHVIWRQLYDVPTERISKNGFLHLATYAGTDSVSIILHEAEPKSAIYLRLKQMLTSATEWSRRQIMVNMERCRWRHPHHPTEYSKYVVVNIPSYELIGVDGDSTMHMRIVCGSRDTKTPLLNSSIMRMDINPRWVMPNSIIKKDIAHHAGNSAYFERHRYHIVNKATGDYYQPSRVTSDMLLSGALRVYQEGGEGNALGRIIFRFDNNFSIFLHDTSSKGTFERMDRRASHGCIRVQKPYELACFLLKDKDEDLMDKISNSMSDDIDSTRLVHSVNVDPKIPLFITYYTMFLLPDGTMKDYSDVYGYDPIIWEKLKPYTSKR